MLGGVVKVLAGFVVGASLAAAAAAGHASSVGSGRATGVGAGDDARVAGVAGGVGESAPMPGTVDDSRGRSAGATARRAMWLWDASAGENAVSWARSERVEEISVYVPTRPGAKTVAHLARLKARADAVGIRLCAANGDPQWTFDHQAAVVWWGAVMDTGLFSCHHVAVRPDLLSSWAVNQTSTATAFVRLLDRLRATGAATIVLDIPFWYDSVRLRTRTLLDEVLRRVDAVNVLTFRDSGTGSGSMMEAAGPILVRARAAHRPVRLAAQVATDPDCPSCTFHEEGRRHLVRTLSSVDAAAAGYSAYAGIVIYDYASWRKMRP